MADQTKRFFIFRGDANGGEEKPYDVPLEEGMVVLDGVHWIQSNVDNDLAVRWNCKAAKCGSCSAEINGIPKLMCKTRVSDYVGKDIHVRPMKTFPVIKDLVTDVSWNYEVAKKIPAFKPSDEKHKDFWKLNQMEVERVQEFRRCIECFLCQNVCHVLRDHDRKDAFYGPRFMTRLASLEMHPMDAGDRIEILKEQAGLDFCNVTAACTDVCPEEIAITNNANIPLKERLTDVYYDPLVRLVRFIFGRKNRGRPKSNVDGNGRGHVETSTLLREVTVHPPVETTSAPTGQTGGSKRPLSETSVGDTGGTAEESSEDTNQQH